jgi:hypothetical protein
VLGVMGYLGISMNIATVMVASIALGVVDDDTIHFINRYRSEVAAGASTDQAIETATTHEGRASLTTAIINSAGYAVLLLSEYKPTAWFGGLLALTMGVAFLAEVTILPATIKLLPGIFGPAALRRGRIGVAAVLLVLVAAATASSQPLPTGHVSTLVDFLPNRSEVTELRARVFAEEKLQPTGGLTITASAFVEALAGRRLPDPATRDRDVVTGIVRVNEASVQYGGEKADLLAGFSRVVWGRLDELQPTDVVNPLDVTRFFFEGRTEARMPVALIRGRVFIGERASFEAVYVPVFRQGRFDQLDEDTSPFNIARLEPGFGVCLAIGCPTLPPAVTQTKPAVRISNAQGGLRVGGTTGRVDWAVAAYRGFEPFGVATLIGAPVPGGPLTIERSHPRFTMVGGDFETVRGAWGLRGEIAAFVEDTFQTPDFRVVEGSSLDAGIGIDRKAGDLRLSGTVLLHHESGEIPGSTTDLERTDVSFIASVDRSFARERYNLRTFGVVTPSESSAFLRTILTATVRDNVAVEGSAGWFPGSGRDFTGRFSECDFVYARLKYYF